MNRIFLTRHGETEWNRTGNRYCGKSDIALSARGEEQAKCLADRLKNENIELVIASSLLRSQQTAAIIAKFLNVDIKVEPEFREIDFGRWEGLLYSEMIADPSSGFAEWLADPEAFFIPGGEPIWDARERISAAFDSLIQRPEQILIVGHNTVNRLLLSKLLDFPVRNYRRIIQSNCNLTIFDRTPEGLHLVTMNEAGFHNAT